MSLQPPGNSIQFPGSSTHPSCQLPILRRPVGKTVGSRVGEVVGVPVKQSPQLLVDRYLSLHSAIRITNELSPKISSLISSADSISLTNIQQTPLNTIVSKRSSNGQLKTHRPILSKTVSNRKFIA